MKSTGNIAADWAEGLGLVEAPLFSSTEFAEGQHSVLLDGGRGSFALSVDTNPTIDLDKVASWVWSSDLSHHVQVSGDQITLMRWDDPSSTRRFTRRSVENKVETFYDYILLDRVKSRFDIIEHSVDVFRRVRSYMHENDLPDQSSIHVFLFILASMLSGRNETSNHEPNALISNFALDENHLEAFLGLGEETIAALIEQFRVPITAPRSLVMVPELLVRHAGGTVFQEAHYEVIRGNPTDLFRLPGRAEIKIETHRVTHFTPPGLARAIVEQAFWHAELGESVTIFDPACGAGAFLHESLRYLQRANYRGRVSLIGFDVSENAVAMARFILGQAVKDWPEGHIERIAIDPCDSLNVNEWPKADFILMNPPFLSWGGLTTKQREQIKEILGKRYLGRPDYSMAFIEKAISSLHTGCILGTLLPASLLSIEASLAWRRHILEQATPYFLAVFGDHGLFRHAIIEVACAVFQKEDQDEIRGVDNSFLSIWTSEKRGAAGEAIRYLRKLYRSIAPSYAIKSPTALEGKGWRASQIEPDTLLKLIDWRPRPNRLGKILDEVRRTFETTVGNIFHVREGIRAGLRKAFIISPEGYQQLPVQERNFFRPIAENKNIKNGCIGAHDYIFYPDAEKVNPIESEADLKRLLPTYFGIYLNPNREELSKRKALRGRDWWILNWARSYFQKPEPKIVSAFFGDAGSFALDIKGIYVVVQGFAWFPHTSLRRQIEYVPKDARTAFRDQVYHAYTALLNSTPFSLLLAEFCPHVAGGQFNLSKRFIDNVPLPNLAELGQQSPEWGELVGQLAEEGEQIQNCELKQRLRIIDNLVARVYRVPLSSWPITD